MLNCRSAVVDWQQTRSDFDVTSTMLKSIANAMYIFWNYVYERELQIVNKISEIEPGTSVCHFTLNRGLNWFWRAHTRGATYTPTHTHSHISCGVTSPAHASQGGSFSTMCLCIFTRRRHLRKNNKRALQCARWLTMLKPVDAILTHAYIPSPNGVKCVNPTAMRSRLH